MIFTASYATATRSGLVVIQTSVGTPQWLAPLPQLEAAKPYGIYNVGLEWPEFAARYLERLADRWDEIEHDLHGLTREFPRFALCCWCREPRTCHRRLLADVIEQHGHGAVPEVSPRAGTVHRPSGGNVVHRPASGTSEPAQKSHISNVGKFTAEPEQLTLDDERTSR